MPRKPQPGEEQIILSPEDSDILSLFELRRSFKPDRSLRYVQVVGDDAKLSAYADGLDPSAVPADGVEHVVALPRLVMQRALGRPLDSRELVRSLNGLNGDCQRPNLTLISRSDLVSKKRTGSWSKSGEKYVYDRNGYYAASVVGVYLGTYSTPQRAAEAVSDYHSLLDQGYGQEDAAAIVLEKGKQDKSGAS